MALDGIILSRAKQIIAERRQKAENELLRKTAAIYAEIPQIKTIDDDIRSTMSDTFSAVLNKSQDTEKIVSALAQKNLDLQDARRKALSAAGYPEDYLDFRYFCPKCEDSGYVGTKPCSCLMDEYSKEQNREITSLMHLTNESFDTFNLNYYKNEYDEKLKINPRKHMSAVFDACRKYAESFGDGYKNLFLTGPTGVGKTFLSACIARTVAARRIYSVVYRTAGEVFADYETARFNHGDERENAIAELNRYRNCDLLILDDLGTELTTAMTVASLYDLINGRLLNGKKTVISSNLSLENIAQRYSPQISSRLSGDYQVLPFCGEDIRLLKKRF